MTSLKQEESRIIIGILIVIGFAYVFFISDPPWQTHGSALAYHSLLGFLSVVVIGSVMNRFIMDPSPAHRVFLAATGYLAVVHLGAALVHMFPYAGPIAHTEPKGVFMGIVEIGILAVMLLVAAYLNSQRPKEGSFWNKRFTPMGLLAISLIVYGLSALISELPAPSPFLIGGGFVIGFITLAAFVISCFFVFKRPEGISSHDKKRLIVSYCLFILSTVVLLLILPSPNSLWLLKLAFQLGALIFMIFATGYPFLLDVGLEEKVAYAFIAVLTSLAVLPFILTQIIEYWLPLVSYQNQSLGIILHLSAAVLSGVIGYVLTERVKDRTPWYDGPAIFALFSWMIIESVIVCVRLLNPNGIAVESLMPYLCGGIIASVAMIIGIRRTLQSQHDRIPQQYSPIRNISYIVVALLVMLIESMLIFIPSLRTQVQQSPLTSTLLLITAYAFVFGVTTFAMLRAAQSGGMYSVEMVGVGSLSLWAVSQILRVNFSVWTAGWWAAEVLLFIIFLFVCPLIAGLYIEKYHLETHLKTASRIYTNLMVDKMNQHHRVALDSLSGMFKHVALEEKEMEKISRALTAVSLANEMVDRFENILKGKAIDVERIEKIDLHDALQAAFERICQIQSQVTELETIECPGHCEVWGDSMVVDLFYNLLKGLLTRIHADAVSVSIERCDDHMWCTSIHISTDSEVQEVMTNLLSRYLSQVSDSNVEFLLLKEYIRLLRGEITVGNSHQSGAQDVITVTVKLPAAEPHHLNTNS
ncbi:MAG: hypothetical protein R6V83_07155 [Candidatus Thorarchaeota archaeon]